VSLSHHPSTSGKATGKSPSPSSLLARRDPSEGFPSHQGAFVTASGRAFGRRAERAERRFGRARESPRPGRQPEDDRRPDVGRAQATRPIFAVSLMSATSAFSSRFASFLNRTQALPMLAFPSSCRPVCSTAEPG
jgi:hypothetical protein